MLNARRFTELNAFIAVAENLSFTRAAERIGLSVPSTSQAVRALESRIGVQLFQRTTRKVVPTPAGEDLLADLTPALARLDGVVSGAIRESGDGARRLGAERWAAINLFAPLLTQFARRYPELHLRIAVDDAAEGHPLVQSGPRSTQRGEEAITIRLFERTRLVTVASPEYLALYAPPESPAKLREHICIRARSPWDQRVHRWEYEKKDERLEVSVDGPLVVDTRATAACAAVAGLGIALLPVECVSRQLDSGKLIELLRPWSHPVPGVSLLHASDRKAPPALLRLVTLLVEFDE